MNENMTATATTGASCGNKLDIEELMATMRKAMEVNARPMSDLVLTVRQAAELRQYAAGVDRFVDGANYEMALYRAPLAGINILVEPEPSSRRVRTGKIVQKDRFATYDAADMVWAEPLGLAEWETVDREAVFFGINQRCSLEFEQSFMSEWLKGARISEREVLEMIAK